MHAMSPEGPLFTEADPAETFFQCFINENRLKGWSDPHPGTLITNNLRNLLPESYCFMQRVTNSSTVKV